MYENQNRRLLKSKPNEDYGKEATRPTKSNWASISQISRHVQFIVSFHSIIFNHLMKNIAYTFKNKLNQRKLAN